MRKVFPIIFLSLLFFSLTIGVVQAEDADWCETISLKDRTGGLVPCGRSCDDPTTAGIDESKACQLCSFFVMIDGWIDGLFFMFVPPLAVLMIAIGGGMYIFSQGSPEMLSRAKKLFTAVAFGLLIVYGAWLIVNTLFMLIGINDFNEFKTLPQNWWKIPCP